MVAEAGYQGMCLDPALSDLDFYLPTKPLFEKYGLEAMFNLFPHTADELKPLLEVAREFNAKQVNVIADVMPIDYRDALPILERWMAEADEMGIPLLIETHRNSTLTDLHYSLQVIDALPQLRLCADLSHFVVGREIELPLTEENSDYFQRILERSDCFQGRIANREQVQVQLNFPQHQDWVALFKNWWKQGMQMWRQRNSEDASLIFLCELGPPSYAITDAQGYELSDRWEEALQIKRWVEQLWGELEQE